MQAYKPTILFVAEAVTLAHYARIITLAKMLDHNSYRIVVASDPRYQNLEVLPDFSFHPIKSISSEKFTQSLADGKPLYDAKTLIQYVEDDLNVLDQYKPDLVIGDFRLSLAVSAPIREIPYAAVVNAYWSPYAETTYPVPNLPVTRIFGTRLAQKIFDLVRPMAFAIHARPLNRARRHYGLPAIGSDLRKTYTWGNYTLYADIPEVIPTSDLPEHHHYLGPILWSTPTQLPDWWDQLPEDKPIVFVTLGSSGQAELLPMVQTALSSLNITLIIATAGKVSLGDVADNVYVADYLPMERIALRAKLIICNGGSLTCYQALASGVPIIGVCSNMDQLLNMQAIERLGVGAVLRAESISSNSLIAAAHEMLNNLSCKQISEQLRDVLQQYNVRHRFNDFVLKATNQIKSK